MSTHTQHKVVDWAVMKSEIENIKTHFATKSDVVHWTVGVGVGTILAVFGIVNEFRKEAREDMQILRQEVQQNTIMLSEKIDKISDKIDTLAKK